MQINFAVIIITGLALAVLIFFLIFKNKKDRKEFENKLNQDYRKPSHRSAEEDPEDVKAD